MDYWCDRRSCGMFQVSFYKHETEINNRYTDICGLYSCGGKKTLLLHNIREYTCKMILVRIDNNVKAVGFAVDWSAVVCEEAPAGNTLHYFLIFLLCSFLITVNKQSPYVYCSCGQICM